MLRRARAVTLTRRFGWAFAATIALSAGPAHGQEATRTVDRPEDQIALFRFTGYEGYALMKLYRDATETATPGRSGAPNARESQEIAQWRTDVFLMTHSYVYLPGFLAIDAGAGPIIDISQYSASGETTRSTKYPYNLTFQATALRDKPYNGMVFYEHLNPTQNVGPSQVLFTESDRYGLNLAVLSPATPVPVHFDASRYRNRGRGTDQTLDDNTDQISLRTTAPVGKLGSSQMRFEVIRVDSRSGSTGLPVQTTRSDSDVLNIDTRLSFGKSRQYDLTNTIYYFAQTYTAAEGRLADSRDLRFNLDMRGLHSDALQTYARFILGSNQTEGQDTVVNNIAGGATYRANPDVYGTLDASGDFIRTTQFDANVAALSLSGNYRRALPFGVASATYSVAGGFRDQTASSDTAAVVGERLALPGTIPVALKREQVVPGTVVISNAQRTQVFVEGVDYALSVVGLVTRVERIASGNIVDGQEVLADYTFQVGGTFSLTRLDQSASFTWNYESYLSAYVRFLDSRPRLQSGQPTFQINPVKDTTVGLRADVPIPFLADDHLVGAFAEREDRREVISPGRRATYEAYVQVPVPLMERTMVRLGARRNNVDYDLSPEQAVRLTAWDFRLWSRPFFGLDVTVEATRDKDTGTPIVRDRLFATAKVTWRIRQFQLGFDYSRTTERQGGYERTRDYAQLVLRRDF